MSEAAIREAEHILAGAGVSARVTASGHDGSVAVVTAAPGSWPALVGGPGAEIARRIRALGFRYVALDLAVHTRDHR